MHRAAARYFVLGERVRVRAGSFGSSLCELELLNALAPAARAGRVRLPLDELAQARVAPEALQAAHWQAPLARAGAHAARGSARCPGTGGQLSRAAGAAAAACVCSSGRRSRSVQSQRLAAALPSRDRPRVTITRRSMAGARWRAARRRPPDVWRAAGAGKRRAFLSGKVFDPRDP